MSRGKIKIGGEYKKANLALNNRLKFFITGAAMMRFSGLEYDYNKLGRLYDPKNRDPEAKARKLMRLSVNNVRVTDMINAEIARLYKEHGVDAEQVIKDENQLLEDCKDENGKFVDRTTARHIIFERRKTFQFDAVPSNQLPGEEISYTAYLDGTEQKQLEE